MKQKKTFRKIITGLLAAVIAAGVIGTGGRVQAATMLPDSIFIAQAESDTCTLASATMMLRAYLYLAGSSLWSNVTEAKVKVTGWAPGLWWYFNYTIGTNSMNVSHVSLPDQSKSKVAKTLRALLDEHPEGIVYFVECSAVQHAVLLTDYEYNEKGSTIFYCADPAGYLSGSRIKLSDSWLGAKLGTQSEILNNAEGYWYISSATVDEVHELKRTAAKAATCTEAGNTAYYTCKICGRYFADKKAETVIAKNSWVIPATGHTYETKTVQATLEKDGKIKNVCSVCGAKGDTVVIPKIESITLSHESFPYTGSVNVPAVVVIDREGNVIPDANIQVTYSDPESSAAGTYKVKVKLTGNYSASKTLKYSIVKSKNAVWDIESSKTIKYSKLKSARQWFKLNASTNEDAEITYALSAVTKKAKNYITVSPNGKVVVKKGLAKGTYKIKLKITTSETKFFRETVITKKIKLIVE